MHGLSHTLSPWHLESSNTEQLCLMNSPVLQALQRLHTLSENEEQLLDTNCPDGQVEQSDGKTVGLGM